MKVVVLGASGMLGQALMVEGGARGHEMIGERVELTDKPTLLAHLEKHQPDIVINSVAITSLQACEDNPRLSYEVNARPARWLSNWCLENGRKLVQISSDQCLDPVNEYATSKRLGDFYALLFGLVVRTNIVGPKNTAWAFDAIENDSPITLFDDYYTSSIDIWSFSVALFDVLENHPETSGILNIASRDTVSKKDFVEALADRMGKTLTKARFGSVKTLKPERATNCGLDVSQIESLLGRQMPGLNDVVNALVERRNQPCTALLACP